MKILTTKTPNNEALFQHAELLTQTDEIDWDGMIEYCKNNNLRWLALPQIGINKSWFVAYFFGKRNIIINPIIAKKSKTLIKSEELCSSLPGEVYVVDRHHSIIAKYNDAYYRIPYPHSIVFQHEYDHLNWVLLFSYK